MKPESLPPALEAKLRQLAEEYREAGKLSTERQREGERRDIRIQAYRAALAAGIPIEELKEVVGRWLRDQEPTPPMLPAEDQLFRFAGPDGPSPFVYRAIGVRHLEGDLWQIHCWQVEPDPGKRYGGTWLPVLVREGQAWDKLAPERWLETVGYRQQMALF